MKPKFEFIYCWLTCVISVEKFLDERNVLWRCKLCTAEITLYRFMCTICEHVHRLLTAVYHHPVSSRVEWRARSQKSSFAWSDWAMWLAVWGSYAWEINCQHLDKHKRSKFLCYQWTNNTSLDLIKIGEFSLTVSTYGVDIRSKSNHGNIFNQKSPTLNLNLIVVDSRLCSRNMTSTKEREILLFSLTWFS